MTKGLYCQQKVHEMMEALDLPLPHEEKPGLENLNFLLYDKLVMEEAYEFDKAMETLRVALEDYEELPPNLITKYWAEAIDAMCDIIVVVHNCSNAMGIDLKPFFDEVHKTNLAKAGGPLNEYGKRLKPPNWEPPKIQEMLLELLELSDDGESG